MNGILIIDKPAGITSHDVVSSVRRILKTKRVGHTGTLDPFATGVMVILVGQATRLAQFLDKDEKEYEADVRFGFETDTGDRTGERRATAAADGVAPLDTDRLSGVLDHFRGEIDQIPPMYSAKKIDGTKLYELARKGEIVERQAVRVNIAELELISIPAVGGDRSTSEQDMFSLRVVCSAGTYIRTLAEEIGRKLGVGAHLAELRRTRAGKFSIDQSLTLEQLAEIPDPASALVSMEFAVSHLSKFLLTAERVVKTKNGLSTRMHDTEFRDGEPVQMLDGADNLIAIGFYHQEQNIVQPKVVLV